MAYLYLDSVSHLKIGLLNDDFHWIEFVETDEKKSSAVIHKWIYELAKKHDVNLKNLKGILKASGPGSYTGMRVSEGVSNIFNWQGVKSYGFYLFEIPKLIGVEKGCWASNAFKNETFIYSWEKEAVFKKLVQTPIEDLISGTSPLYSSDSNFIKCGAEDVYTTVRCQERALFSSIVRRGNDLAPFYYRSLENEFKQA